MSSSVYCAESITVYCEDVFFIEAIKPILF